MSEVDKMFKEKLDEYRKLPFEELEKWADSKNVITSEATIAGKDYQMDIDARWDDKSKKTIRVTGFITSNRPRHWWQSFMNKESYGFIKDSNGNFIGEDDDGQ
jgi:hypothetical protein